jgi:uncharacterized membrane protein
VTIAKGINDLGQIVGIAGNNGFLDTGGVFSTIAFPGATFTDAFGINDAGQIVGTYFDSSLHAHGFVDSGGTYTSINIPFSGVIDTYVYGINDSGQIVGQYITTSNDFGFVATPAGAAVPEPSAWVLAGIGCVVVGCCTRRKKNGH